MKKLKPLQKNDAVNILAPSSHFKREDFLSGVQKLEKLGLNCFYRKDIFQKNMYFAGDDARRFQEAKLALKDDQTKALFFARGGYGALRILSNFSKLPKPKTSKIIAGFSDATTLLTFINQKWQWPVFYAPHVTSLAELSSQSFAFKSFKNMFFGKTDFPFTVKNLKVLKKGKAKAPLTGGCLSLLTTSLGTPFEWNTDNKILFLEDVGEKPYALDRMLTHLRLAGKFKKVRGIIWGSLGEVRPKKEYLKMLEQVFLNDSFPIFYDFPAGHQKQRLSFPLGLDVSMNSQNQSVSFLESPWM